MQLEICKRQRRYPSLTSLIDIIFLLLLFFMLSSTFSKYAEVQVASAVPNNKTDEERPKFFVSITNDEWRVNGKSVPLNAVIDFFMQHKSKDQSTVILKLEKGITAQKMVEAIKTLRQANMQPILVQ